MATPYQERKIRDPAVNPGDQPYFDAANEGKLMPARNGAAAATMVASGMTGIDDVFSGERSLFFAFGQNAKPELLTQGLGENYEILRTNIKRWTVGSPIQAPLDSLSTLLKEHKFKAADVEKVVVRVSQQGARTVNNRHMRSRTSGASSAFVISSLSFATIGCGVAFGTSMPNHVVVSKPFTPDSATVGMSGSTGTR